MEDPNGTVIQRRSTGAHDRPSPRADPPAPPSALAGRRPRDRTPLRRAPERRGGRPRHRYVQPPAAARLRGDRRGGPPGASPPPPPGPPARDGGRPPRPPAGTARPGGVHPPAPPA